METLDFIKLAILLTAFFIAAPLVGMWMRNRMWAQKFTFFAMCFMVTGGLLHAQEWGLTIHPILYRGTSRGFHFWWAEVAAVTLIWAKMSGDWLRFRYFPPGLWLYFLWCFACLLSVINAPIPLHSAFEAFKDLKMVVIFVAAYNFIQTSDDLRTVLSCMVLVMFWQLFAVLKQKYVDHIYQVWGTFEHQNSLCMFTILIGMVFLSVALGPKHRTSNLYLLGYLACAAIVQSTLSRGGLVIFAMGSLMVVGISLLERPTKRRLMVTCTLALVGAIGLMFTLDTIVQRFKDYGNQESKHTRDMLNKSASMMLHDFPLGVGWNNFALMINKPYYYGDHIDNWQLINGNSIDPDYKKGVVESLYWLLLSETGYQGFATYILLVTVFMFWNLRAAWFFRKQFLGTVAVGIFIGLSMNYAQSILERILIQPRNMMLWFILLAITARIETWRRAEKKRRKVLQQQRHHAQFQHQNLPEQELITAG